jgi:hypothetical protein
VRECQTRICHLNCVPELESKEAQQVCDICWSKAKNADISSLNLLHKRHFFSQLGRQFGSREICILADGLDELAKGDDFRVQKSAASLNCGIPDPKAEPGQVPVLEFFRRRIIFLSEKAIHKFVVYHNGKPTFIRNLPQAHLQLLFNHVQPLIPEYSAL